MPDKINFSDFQKLDIRIGTVIEAVVPEWSHWVMKLTADLGPEIGTRIVFAGIMKFYKPEELVGKQFPFVVNLEPKKMGPMGDFSEGMMIMACEQRSKDEGQRTKENEEEKPILLSPWGKLPAGSKIR
jgi:methionine--tRNA ligase beta chain